MKHAMVISVNVGGVRQVPWKGRTVATGIFKAPVDGPVRVRGVNLEGDDQADRTVHGGPDKAVYAFPTEHYPAWREAFPAIEMPWGAFGENLTTQGLLEQDVRIGDRFRVGTVELTVTQPRMPCFKFAIRMGDPRVLRHMIETGHTGFYFAISREGELQAGDTVQYLGGPDDGLPVAELTRLYHRRDADERTLRAAAASPGLPETWRDWLLREARQAAAGGRSTP